MPNGAIVPACRRSITKLAYGQSAGIVQLQPSEKAHFEVIFAQCCQNPSSCTRWRNTTGSTGSSNESVANLCALAGNVCNAEGFLQVLDASGKNLIYPGCISDQCSQSILNVLWSVLTIYVQIWICLVLSQLPKYLNLRLFNF